MKRRDLLKAIAAVGFLPSAIAAAPVEIAGGTSLGALFSYKPADGPMAAYRAALSLLHERVRPDDWKRADWVWLPPKLKHCNCDTYAMGYVGWAIR